MHSYWYNVKCSEINKNKMKYQNYKHYKLPITINPLEYGKLIKLIKQLNIFIVSVTPRTITIISQYDDFNLIEFYRDGNLIFNYRDHKITENTFIRSLEDKKFTFKNNELIQIEYQKSIMLLLILLNNTTLLNFTLLKWKT